MNSRMCNSKIYFINSLDESNGYEAEKGQQSNHNQHEHHEDLKQKVEVNVKDISTAFDFICNNLLSILLPMEEAVQVELVMIALEYSQAL